MNGLPTTAKSPAQQQPRRALLSLPPAAETPRGHCNYSSTLIAPSIDDRWAHAEFAFATRRRTKSVFACQFNSQRSYFEAAASANGGAMDLASMNLNSSTKRNSSSTLGIRSSE